MGKTTFIYALCEPNSRTVRYIGKADKPNRRFREHLRDSVKKQTHLGCWLRSLVSQEEKPVMVVLREIPIEQWEIAEERYIRLARGCGMPLVNATDGGGGCLNLPTEAREKMSAFRRGRKDSLETRAKKSASMRGMPKPVRTPEHIAALTASIVKNKSLSGDKNPMFGKTGQKSPHFGKKNPNASSPFLGVYLNSSNGMWISRIRCDGREYFLGKFLFEKEAALAYDSKAKLLYGSTAKLNFPV